MATIKKFAFKPINKVNEVKVQMKYLINKAL